MCSSIFLDSMLLLKDFKHATLLHVVYGFTPPCKTTVIISLIACLLNHKYSRKKFDKDDPQKMPRKRLHEHIKSYSDGKKRESYTGIEKKKQVEVSQ